MMLQGNTTQGLAYAGEAARLVPDHASPHLLGGLILAQEINDKLEALPLPDTAPGGDFVAQFDDESEAEIIDMALDLVTRVKAALARDRTCRYVLTDNFVKYYQALDRLNQALGENKLREKLGLITYLSADSSDPFGIELEVLGENLQAEAAAGGEALST